MSVVNNILMLISQKVYFLYAVSWFLTVSDATWFLLSSHSLPFEAFADVSFYVMKALVCDWHLGLTWFLYIVTPLCFKLR